ncbi:MAG: response regulator [Rhodospirillales bacterium]|nr:response regulator [Rhodospirillales bacterium]
MRILVVDDDSGVRETLSDLLRVAGHSVASAAAYSEAVALLARPGWDAMVADLVLPGGSGLDLAVLARSKGLGAVVCSGHPQRIAQLQSQGIAHLVKPFSATALEAALAAVAPPGA